MNSSTSENGDQTYISSEGFLAAGLVTLVASHWVHKVVATLNQRQWR